jgi:gamma-glutamyltranspeptidase / glutathione hydrolase
MPRPTSILSPYLSHNRTVTKPSVRSKGGIVVSQNRAASEAGARVLKAGGHAVDAAVATAMTLGVVEPWMSGIGGVGAMLIRDGKTGAITCLDFGAVSPKSLDPKDYPVIGGTDGNLFGWPQVKGHRNTVGATAVATPTQPLGLATAHKMFGRKRWRDLLGPAIQHAEDGLVVDWHTMLEIASALGDLRNDPGAAKRFLRDGLPPQPPVASLAGQVVRLPVPDLACTLKALAEDGTDTLYKGALGRSIAADIKAMGGCLSTDDLAHARCVEFAPLEIAYGDRTIHVLPELNGGPTLAVAYAELQRIRKRVETKPNGKTFSAYAAALQHAWADRFARLGDAGERTAPTCTTHLSVVDRDGNMVTLTQTLLSLFGSRVVLPKSGILMNNGINWFDPMGGPNGIAPGRRALANYAPAIMTGGGETIAIGGCGGRKIIPAVFQLLALIADFGLDLNDAFHQPRIDVSGGTTVAVDHRLGDKAIATLAEHHDIVLAEPVPYPTPFTIAGAVRRSRNQNEGATDPEMPWSEAIAEDSV